MKADARQQTGEKLMRVVMFTLTFSAMSVLMFNFVLPEIRASYGLATAQVSWVTSAYVLIYGVGTVIYGKLADRYQLKHILTFGLLFFAFGSLVGLASQSYGTLLLGRCLQAIGAAAIPATAMLIPIRYFPPGRRGSALSTAFVGLALGTALGPVISAIVVSIAHWRWLFCIPLFILATLPFYRKYLRDEPVNPGRLDWIGGGLLAAAVTLLLLFVTNGGGWFALGSALAVLLFIKRIRAADEPFVQPELFRNKRYVLGLVTAFLVSGIGFSLAFLSPLLLAQVYALPASWIGFAMVPAALSSALLGRRGGRIADRRGTSFLFYVASVLLISCFVLLSTFAGTSAMLIAAILILGNVGLTFMMIALSNSVSLSLSGGQVGVGMGLMSMSNFISGSIASGIYGKWVDIGADVNWNPLNLHPSSFIYSNIYLLLAALLACILALYLRQAAKEKAFGEMAKTNE